MAEAIVQVLKKNNYSVDLAHDGVFGLDCALSSIYDGSFLILCCQSLMEPVSLGSFGSTDPERA
jgi:hypothetical protein